MILKILCRNFWKILPEKKNLKKNRFLKIENFVKKIDFSVRIFKNFKKFQNFSKKSKIFENENFQNHFSPRWENIFWWFFLAVWKFSPLSIPAILIVRVLHTEAPPSVSFKSSQLRTFYWKCFHIKWSKRRRFPGFCINPMTSRTPRKAIPTTCGPEPVKNSQKYENLGNSQWYFIKSWYKNNYSNTSLLGRCKLKSRLALSSGRHRRGGTLYTRK